MINKYSILNGPKYFFSGRLQNYLVFISTRNLSFVNNKSNKIESWGSKGMAEENIKNPHTSNINSPKLIGE